MNRWLAWATDPGALPKGAALGRGAAGLVFVVSGAVKFLHENQGAGRFAKIGFPEPAAVAGFVGAVEIVFGMLLLIGLFARVAALVLAADMVVAITSTKLPLLWGGGPEPVGAPPKMGAIAFLYQARLDLTMLAITVGVVLCGAGLASLDAKRRATAEEKPRSWS
jgi:putative oxidoreductase